MSRSSCHVFTLLLAFTLATLPGCQREIRHNGYRISSASADDFGLIGPSLGVLVGPKIVKWGAYKEYLMIFKVPHSGIHSHIKWAERRGYIITNTKTGDMTFLPTKKKFEDVAVNQFKIPLRETELEPMY